MAGRISSKAERDAPNAAEAENAHIAAGREAMTMETDTRNVSFAKARGYAISARAKGNIDGFRGGVRKRARGNRTTGIWI